MHRHKPAGNLKRIVGMMSGTSADGIDAVVAEISRGSRFKAFIRARIHQNFSADLRKQILEVSNRGTVSRICELNFRLGECFATAALKAIHKAKLSPKNVDAIASHGQTIHHLPNGAVPSTLQIGEPAVIAARTGVPTIADFRVADMAVGGQGAPLVTYADWALLAHARHPRIIQNIGGIANLTWLPAACTIDDVAAFDTGPGNMVIDGMASAISQGRRSYDKNGAMAAKGKVCRKLVAELMNHPFILRRPPKTTGREEFGAEFATSVLKRTRALRLSDNDIMASVTTFTVESIVDSYERFIFSQIHDSQKKSVQIILGGGGTKNSVLVGMLKERVECEVLTHEDFGIDNHAKEALAFAVLGYETLHGRPSNVPSATGATRATVLGKLVYP